MKMRLHSDIHLEQFYGQREERLAAQFIPEDERDIESILVLAGDISSKPPQLYAFLKYIVPRFQCTFFVNGNHELYHQELVEWTANFKKEMGSFKGLFSAVNEVRSTIFNSVRFIYTTLWADGGKSAYERGEVERGLVDFRLIRVGAERFTVPRMVELHEKQKTKLIELLQEPFNGKTIVITHHLPSYKLCHPRFGTDLNGGFASDCDHLLASDYAPAIWIFGHTHDRISTKLWNTQLESNPTGYVSERSSPFRGGDKVFIDIDG